MSCKKNKLQQISGRIWTCVTNTIHVTASPGRGVGGYAFVAKETRKISQENQIVREKAMFEDNNVKMEGLKAAIFHFHK